MEKILTTSEEIRAIVKEAVAEVMTEFAKSSKPETPQKASDLLNLREALAFLNENGYALAECTLRNKVYHKELPYQKVGRSVVFSRKELTSWLEDVTSRPNSRAQAVAAQLAKSANNQGA